MLIVACGYLQAEQPWLAALCQLKRREVSTKQRSATLAKLTNYEIQVRSEPLANFTRTMFALNLNAMSSEVGWVHPSTLGWIVIAITWAMIGTVWLAGSLWSANKASQSCRLPQSRGTRIS